MYPVASFPSSSIQCHYVGSKFYPANDTRDEIHLAIFSINYANFTLVATKSKIEDLKQYDVGTEMVVNYTPRSRNIGYDLVLDNFELFF